VSKGIHLSAYPIVIPRIKWASLAFPLGHSFHLIVKIQIYSK